MLSSPSGRTASPLGDAGCAVVQGDCGQSTPATNRGVENTEAFNVHWLTGTTYLDEIDVLDAVHRVTGGADFVRLKGGRNFYGTVYGTVGGLKVLTDPLEPGTMPPVCVDVPGKACEFLGLAKVQELAAILKPTRVDLAFDGAPFTPAVLAAAVREGNIRCRAQVRTFTEGLDGAGDTLQLGSRSSSQQLVVYDRRGFTRSELRLKGERAELAYEALTGPPEALREAAMGWLSEFVGFVDASKDGNVSRAPALPFWEAFVAGVDRLRMSLSSGAALTLERTRAWIDAQVAPSLAMLEAAGVDLILSVVGPARARLRGRHRAILVGAGVGVT